MAKSSINIRFPFQDSPKGYYLDLTTNTADAIKSDLMHLILTKKGSRYYKPDFGTNLLRFIFEPNDGLTHSMVTQDITDTVKKYLPNLSITNIGIVQSENNEHVATVTINYTITEGVFEESDSIIINI